MNIFLFELKAQLRSFIIWTAVILILLIVFMTGMYQVFYDSKDAVVQVIQNFPARVCHGLRLVVEMIFNFSGFFAFSMSYLVLAGAIMAVSVAVSIFAREKRAKCTDFILTKPVSREKIFMIKLLSGLALIVATNIIFIAAAIILYTAGGNENSGLGEFVYASCSLFFTQIVFFSIGVVYAALARKVRSVSGAATAIGFAGSSCRRFTACWKKIT
jgi:ABC-type transport system involved in multi-copper enzyme maturation permease subunit